MGQLRSSSASSLDKIDRTDGDESKETNSDKVLLEDFRVAFSVRYLIKERQSSNSSLAFKVNL